MKAKTMTDIIAEHQRQVQELTQRIGELCQQVNERDALIVTLKRDLNIYREHYRQNEKRCTECGGSLDDDGDGTRCHLCCEYPSSAELKRKPIIDRCATCGLALNDDGTCDDCFLAGMQLGLIDAKDKPNDKSCHTD